MGLNDKTRKENSVEVEKSLRSGFAEFGTHPHALVRNHLKTLADGRHRHIFIVRDTGGQLHTLYTDLDGEHWHSIEEQTSMTTEKGESAHQHIVRVHLEIKLENGKTLHPGMIFITKRDGAHIHGAEMLDTTNYDGGHDHTVNLFDDMAIESIDLPEFWEIFGPFDLEHVIPIYSTEQIEDRFSGQCYSPVCKSYSGYLENTEPSWKLALAASLGVDLDRVEPQEIVFKEDEVQELILSKKKFKSLEAVKEKLVDLDYKEASVEDQPNAFRAEIKKPSKFRRDTLRELKLEAGIRVVVGAPKDKLIQKTAVSPADKESDELEFDRIAQMCPSKVGICKQDEEKRIVTGIVLEPDVEDEEGDTITEEEIEKSAAFFLQKSRTIGYRHVKKAKASLIGSMVMPAAFTVNGPNGKQKVKKGTWLISIHVPDDKLWSDIKKKKINAFSVGGFGAREEIGKEHSKDSRRDFGELDWVA